LIYFQFRDANLFYQVNFKNKYKNMTKKSIEILSTAFAEELTFENENLKLEDLKSWDSLTSMLITDVLSSDYQIEINSKKLGGMTLKEFDLLFC